MARTINSEAESRDNQEPNKDRIALIVSIIFVLAVGLLAYRYFNDPSNELSKAISNIKISTETEMDEDTLSTNDIRASLEGAKESGSEEKSQTGESANVTDGYQLTKEDKANTWSAKNYNQGDIEPGSEHTVVSGDTLWELAEGAYGDGSQWTRILDANADLVGYMPSGQQSLIVPGQVLVIPA